MKKLSSEFSLRLNLKILTENLKKNSKSKFTDKTIVRILSKKDSKTEVKIKEIKVRNLRRVSHRVLSLQVHDDGCVGLASCVCVCVGA